MNANVGIRRVSFFTLNGRDVFMNGGLTRWRCPVCAWWRDWHEERCCGCGLVRDDPAATGPRPKAARAGSH